MASVSNTVAGGMAGVWTVTEAGAGTAVGAVAGFGVGLVGGMI